MSRRLLTALLLAALAAALAASPVLAGPSHGKARSDIVVPLVDFCAGASADAVQYVPSSFSGSEWRSGSGAYAYKGSGGPGTVWPSCNFWITDVKLAGYSNGGNGVLLDGSAYDLPSSSGPGGTLPGNAEDCNRFTLKKRFYRQLSTESSFTYLGGSTFKGNWGGGTCSLVQTGATATVFGKNTSGSGWDTYRVAVSVQERPSGQEARSLVAPYIAPPA
jgi:hypothetical protein